MNATETAVLETVASRPEGFTVNEIGAAIGKSETTVRKALKNLGDVVKDETTGNYRLIVINFSEPTVETEPITCDYPNSHPGYPCNHAVFVDDTEDEPVIDTEQLTAEVTSGEKTITEAYEEIKEAVVRKYQRHATPTTRTVRKNQITGAEVQVLKNGETDRDGNEIKVGTKWATRCLTHGATGQFDKVLDAHYASSYPTFCPECATKIPAEAIGRRRRGTTAN